MGESIKRETDNLGEQFVLPDFAVRQYSPLTLAYIGDGIYELIIRTMLAETYDEPVKDLHRRATALVKADTQSAMIGIFEEQNLLTEEEQKIFHRGRNAKAATHAKNANIQEYRRATGFEAVCGYLYLKGDMKRLLELVRKGLEGLHPDAPVVKESSGRTVVQESRNVRGSH